MINRNYNSIIIGTKLPAHSSALYKVEDSIKKSVEHDATLSVFTRVIDRMEQTEGYEPGKTKVAIVGKIESSPINKGREGWSEGTGLHNDYSVTYYQTYEAYLKYTLGYNVKIISKEESSKIAENQEVIDMECFPSNRSVQFVRNTLVIKLSEVSGSVNE